MSRLLAIETSSEACSLALSIDGELNLREYHEPRRHAELLLPAVQALLAESGMSLKQLDAIAFGRGPGSFTSLRIGIGAVQGLAWGAELGVVPVSSLAALAQGVTDRHGAGPGTTVITAMDARMGEVFHAHYLVSQAGLVVLQGDEQVANPAAVEIPPVASRIGAGNGFERYAELKRISASLNAVFADLWPSAAGVARLALDWLERKAPLPPHMAQPVYIRDEVAKKPGED